MKKHFKLILILLSVSFLLANMVWAENIKWYYSFGEGLRMARENNKPIMIEFFTRDCDWCKELDRKTFTDPGVIDLLEKFVCIKLDADENESIVNKYNARGYPHMIFTNANGEKFYRIIGYLPPADFILELKSALKKFNLSGDAGTTSNLLGAELPILIDFSKGKAASSKANIYYTDCDFSKAYDKSYHLRMLYPGISSLKISFVLKKNPSSSAYLYIRHLTSMAGPKAGWAPISIYVNGKKLINQWDTGSGGYINSKFRIGHLLTQGSNSIEFKLDSGAKTHYWVKEIEIK